MVKWSIIEYVRSKIAKKPKMDTKNGYFSKRAQDFELLKQVPESSHLTKFND